MFVVVVLVLVDIYIIHLKDDWAGFSVFCRQRLCLGMGCLSPVGVVCLLLSGGAKSGFAVCAHVHSTPISVFLISSFVLRILLKAAVVDEKVCATF